MHQDLSHQVIRELSMIVLISLLGKPVFTSILSVEIHHHLSGRTSSWCTFVDCCHDFTVREGSSTGCVAFVDGFCEGCDDLVAEGVVL